MLPDKPITGDALGPTVSVSTEFAVNHMAPIIGDEKALELGYRLYHRALRAKRFFEAQRAESSKEERLR